MKRLLAIILALTIVLGLCACGSSGAGEEGSAATGFQVGYAREDIMPDIPIGLSGFANTNVRRSTGYKDILYTTCLAFSEGDDTMLTFSVDVISMGHAAQIREAITKETGIPAGNIMISATHTHSGPEYTEEPYFSNIFIPAFVTAAKNAIADLAPATMYGTKALAEDMAFVRHYITQDGTYIDNNTAANNKAMVTSHAREADPEMVIVKFDREGDKKDISLINWQCHPCFSIATDTYLSADFIAPIRDKVEKETGMQMVYFTGAAGDLGSTSFVSGGKVYKDPIAFGETLADIAITAMNGTMTKIEGSGLKLNHKRFEYASNRNGIERLEDAQKVMDYSKQYPSYDDPAVNAYAKQLGFATGRECATIVYNSQRPEKDTMELNALYLGGLALVTAPYEMCAQDGVIIKQGSPFDFTIVCSLSNEHYSYFARKEAFESKSTIYEVTSAKFAKGAAEATAAELVSMLKGLQ